MTRRKLEGNSFSRLVWLAAADVLHDNGSFPTVGVRLFLKKTLSVQVDMLVMHS